MTYREMLRQMEEQIEALDRGIFILEGVDAPDNVDSKMTVSKMRQTADVTKQFVKSTSNKKKLLDTQVTEEIGKMFAELKEYNNIISSEIRGTLD